MVAGKLNRAAHCGQTGGQHTVVVLGYRQRFINKTMKKGNPRSMATPVPELWCSVQFCSETECCSTSSPLLNLIVMQCCRAAVFPLCTDVSAAPQQLPLQVK